MKNKKQPVKPAPVAVFAQVQSGPFRATLGQAVRDTLTGKAGFVTMRAERLYGGPLCFLEGADKWVEEERLEDDSNSTEAFLNPWASEIEKYLQGKQEVAIEDILRDVLKIEELDWTQGDRLRVGTILRRCLWEKCRLGEPRSWRPLRRRA